MELHRRRVIWQPGSCRCSMRRLLGCCWRVTRSPIAIAVTAKLAAMPATALLIFESSSRALPLTKDLVCTQSPLSLQHEQTVRQHQKMDCALCPHTHAALMGNKASTHLSSIDVLLTSGVLAHVATRVLHLCIGSADWPQYQTALKLSGLADLCPHNYSCATELALLALQARLRLGQQAASAGVSEALHAVCW